MIRALRLPHAGEIIEKATRLPMPRIDCKMERAIALSKDKYCSVYHTLRKDLKHTGSYTIEHEK